MITSDSTNRGISKIEKAKSDSIVLFMKVELVTTLKRQETRMLAELHGSKEPVLITEHGNPSAYLVDLEDY